MRLRSRFAIAPWLLTVVLSCASGARQTAVGTTASSSVSIASASALTPPPAAPAQPKFPAGWAYPLGPGQSVGAKGMVATDSTIASKVGLEVLAAGGNAVDAAIATAFALAVAYPMAGNLGGGGFMVARVGGASHALDFRETAPAAATHDMYVGKDGKPTGDARQGYRASGVPGSVAGLWEAFQKLGSKTKTWPELVAPAIKLADEGFVVDAALAKSLGAVSKRWDKYPATMALFAPGGTPITEGTTWKNPELARTLRRIAEKGPSGFYEGPTADLIAAEMTRGKGILTTADLKAYKAKWRTPLEFTYRGKHVHAMPPPSSGGITLAMICHIVEAYELAKLEWHSPTELHYVLEAMRRAFASRNARLGDPDFVKNPLDELMSDAWASSQRASIKGDRATPSSEIVSAGSSGDGPHTTHFSIVDAQGNAVALTTTLNWWYGSGITVTGAGFLMNNEMDDFASVPGTANGYGLVQSEPNAVAPGKRMLSSMAPTIVTGEDGKVLLVLGAAGGPRIISTVFNIMSNVIDFGFDVTTSSNAPRFHQQHLPDVVDFEKGGLEDSLRKGLEAMGYTMREQDHLADAPAIGKGDKGWIGAAELRRGGGFAAGW
jgi:gamma-glutamyltranspeptidase/glutathione hydrolase